MRENRILYGRIPDSVELSYYCKYCGDKVKLGLPLDRLNDFALINPNGTLHNCYGLVIHQTALSLPFDIILTENPNGENKQ